MTTTPAAQSAAMLPDGGDAKDAARYRWLTNNESYAMFVAAENKAELDAAIDAAMHSPAPEGK